MVKRNLAYTFLEGLLLHPSRSHISRACIPRYLPACTPSLTTTTRRHASAYRAVTPVRQSSHRLPESILQSLDERIGALNVQLVDENNKIQEPTALRSLLSNINRDVDHLRKVSEGRDGVPIVKLVSRESLVEFVRNQEAMSKKKDVSDLAKQVELNWAVSENDLTHRLRKMQEFLAEGKRLEVLIAPKKRGRRASPEEIEGLLQRIRETVAAVEGAGGWKETQGTPGKVMELYFKGKEEGTAALREQAKAAMSEKAMRKEQEKAEKQQKHDARMKRKEEERRKQEQEKARLGIPIKV